MHTCGVKYGIDLLKAFVNIDSSMALLLNGNSEIGAQQPYSEIGDFILNLVFLHWLSLFWQNLVKSLYQVKTFSYVK